MFQSAWDVSITVRPGVVARKCQSSNSRELWSVLYHFLHAHDFSLRYLRSTLFYTLLQIIKIVIHCTPHLSQSTNELKTELLKDGRVDRRDGFAGRRGRVGGKCTFRIVRIYKGTCLIQASKFIILHTLLSNMNYKRGTLTPTLFSNLSSFLLFVT